MTVKRASIRFLSICTVLVLLFVHIPQSRAVLSSCSHCSPFSCLPQRMTHCWQTQRGIWTNEAELIKLEKKRHPLP